MSSESLGTFQGPSSLLITVCVVGFQNILQYLRCRKHKYQVENMKVHCKQYSIKEVYIFKLVKNSIRC